MIVLDNLFMGHRQAVPSEATFVEGDLANRETIDSVMAEHRPSGVLHFASRTLVGESMSLPFAYLGENVRNALNLLESMMVHGVKKLVFSSTANLFNSPKTVPISEMETIVPGSPYGESKFVVERLLFWLKKTQRLRYACLRYFNAAGATQTRGEDHSPETHLIPLVLQVALEQRERLSVFGDDYETPDGTYVSDYVHISDLATAHILAYERLSSQESMTYNLGNGCGFSILEVIEAARRITGKDIPVETVQRRPRDPATLVADSQLIKAELGWRPQYSSLDEIVASAWKWHESHPKGYLS